jgi:DNA-directed RNA polymerase subunit L
MQSPKGNVEMAKYYIEDRIQDIFTSNITYSNKANPSNTSISLQGPP